MPLCPLCPAILASKHIGRHVNTVHPAATAAIVNEIEGSNRWHDCHICGQLCNSLLGKLRHMRTHPAAALINAQPDIVLNGNIFANFQPMEAAVVEDAVFLLEEGAVIPADAIDAAAIELAVAPDIAAVGPGNVAAAEEVVDAGNNVDEALALNNPDPLLSLVTLFRRGLYSTHESWLSPMQHITRDLLELSVQYEGLQAAEALAALQLLPGLVEHSRSSRGRVLPPVQFLRMVENSPDRVSEIIRWARLWSAELPPRRPANWDRANAEQIRQRIELLITQGRLSSAATMATVLENLLDGAEPQAPMPAAAMAARIAVLHPPDDDRDVLPSAAQDPAVEDSIQITADEMRERLYKLNRDSSAGNSGWTNRLLRFITEDRDVTIGINNPVNGIAPPNALHQAFTALCNKALRGEITGTARELMTTARLIMIPKPDGGYRPIRIVCAIQRVFGGAICAAARRLLGNSLRPFQLGGAFKSGAEIMARYMDIAYAQGDTIIKVDISNAFNTVRHRPIFDGIVAMVPGIARYFRFQYGNRSIMRNNEGEINAYTRTGVGQGDPCGPLYFEIGLHPALLRLSQLIQEIEADYYAPVTRQGSVMAYEDDTVLRGEPRIMFLLAPQIAATFAAFGFEVKVEKSQITGVGTEEMEGQPADFVVASSGLIALGIPIGDLHYCTAQTKDLLLRMAPPLQALRLLRPRSGFQLVSKCFTGRPAYILRASTVFAHVAKFAKDFDDSICAAVTQIFQLTMTEVLRTRIYLPRNHGGIGLLRHHGMITEKNQLISRLLLLDYLGTYHPTELPFTQEHYDLNAIHMGDCEGVRELTEISEEDMAAMTHQTAGAILKAGKAKAASKVSEQLRTDLASSIGTRQQAAWFLSSTPGCTAFLDSTAGLNAEKFFSSEDFRCAGRAKLGMGPSNDPPASIKVCACRRVYVTGEEPFHGVSCPLNQSLRTFCHTDILDLLYVLLKKRYPAADISKEKVVGEMDPVDGIAHSVRADIVARIGPVTHFIDVSSADPGCRKAMAAVPSSVTQGDAAAKAREATKKAHYSKVTTPARLPAGSVIPFVIETTGRLGPAAISFIFSICGTHTLLRSRFLDAVVMLCNRYNGKMLRATRDRFALYPQNGGQVIPVPA